MTVVFLHFRNLMVPDETLNSLSNSQHLLLHLVYPLTTGTEAVMLFFVLSGFVLMLSYIKGNSQTYGIFVIRRILRIYGPYLFALALAVCGAAIWHGHQGMDEWGEAVWSKPLSASLIFQHILMIGVYNTQEYNPVFWTLVEEMRISLIYPVLAYLVLRLPAKYSLLLAAVLALLARGVMRIWPHDHWILTLEYMGMFLCGMVLSKNFTSVGEWYASRKARIRIGLAFLGVVLYVAAHIARHASEWLMTFASVMFIVVALVSRRAGKFLSLGFIKYLGRISYSLYLVHIPVLFALTIVLHPMISAWEILPLYVFASVALASIFYVVIEKSFSRLSRQVARVEVAETNVKLAY